MHTAVAVDVVGGTQGTISASADCGGYEQLAVWAASFGQVLGFGVEGTGSYGAELTSFLRLLGHKIVEVNRPDRRVCRQRGKSDPIGAENAARAVLAGTATATPKSAEGTVEMIRHTKIARDTAVKSRTQAMVTLKTLIVTVPDELRDVHRRTFATRTEARLRIATWITDFYNTHRLHSVCGYRSPIDYENEYWASLTVGLAA